MIVDIKLSPKVEAVVRQASQDASRICSELSSIFGMLAKSKEEDADEEKET